MIAYIKSSANVKDFLIYFYEKYIGLYQLNEITNGHIQETPSITGVHPLIMEGANMDATGNNDFESILPAISVEELSKPETLKRLGYIEDIEIVDDTYLDILKLTEDNISDPGKRQDERLRQGLFVNDSIIDQIEALKDSIDPIPLYARNFKWLHWKDVLISIWSDMLETRDILLPVIEMLTWMAKKTIEKNFTLRDLTVTSQSGLYNTDFGRILYGAEISIKFLSSQTNVIIDETITDIKNVEEVYPFNELNTGTPDIIGPKFVTK